MQPPGKHAAAAQEKLLYMGKNGSIQGKERRLYVTFLRNDFQERQEDNANGASSCELRTGNGCSVLAGRGAGYPEPQRRDRERLVPRGPDPVARRRR